MVLARIENRSKANECFMAACNRCALRLVSWLSGCILSMPAILVHILGSGNGQIIRTAGTAKALPLPEHASPPTRHPPPPITTPAHSTEPGLLCARQEVGRRRCVDYSPVQTTSPHPTEDVFSVTVSTSPSGHIPDIWTAAGSLRVMQLEG